ncbi:MAG: putative transposase [Acidimicrobiales bacterium]
MRRGQQLPLSPAGSVVVAPGVDLLEVDEGGVVFVWGRATWCWEPGDVTARRMAAVQLVETRSARRGEVAAGFGTDPDTLRRWRWAYGQGGVEALRPAKRGPKGPSKLHEATLVEIRRLRGRGASMDDVAAAVGLSRNSVSRALAGEAPTGAGGGDEEATGAALEPLARPEPRTTEREAARCGELAEAAPVICEGASLPLAGALVVLPALVATGLLEVAKEVYGLPRASFYGLRSLVLSVVFAVLWGEPRAEGVTRIDPVDAGRLLGLDRAPEVKTIRRRIEALAAEHRADRLLAGLARRHAAGHDEAMGVLYVDGHVRAYHGGADVPKAHVARIRLSMPAEVDTWVADANGDGLLVWSAPPGASLVGELRRVATEVRALVGPQRRPTIAFDRGGWSPKLFAELVGGGFEILTYRKKPCRPEPRSAFVRHVFTDDRGRPQEYWLADRGVRIPYKDHNKERYFACRQVTRLDPGSGHQTQVLTTRTDADPAPIAYAMFSRWRQENFFRYMRAHYALDGLDAYATVGDDPARLVPNPARKDADRHLSEARQRLAAAEAEEGRAMLGGRRTKDDTTKMGVAFAEARAEIDRLHAAARAIPAKAALGDSHPAAARLDPERKRIHDAIRMATYNAESALARLLAPHYCRAEDEARSLLREIFRSPADLRVVGHELHVGIKPLSAPRRTRALAGLCADLTATRTTYPGTDLTLVYAITDN